MSMTILLIISFALLAAANFFSKRRFGLLGLGLAAGLTLSNIWTNDASYIVSAAGIVPENMVISVTTIAIILLPSLVIMMFKGKKYKSMLTRIFGALIYGLVATVFIITPLNALASESVNQQLADILMQSKDLIIGVGLVFAVVDLLLPSPAPKQVKKSKR